MDYVNNKKGGIFFVYGYGGNGKTYIYKTTSVALCSQGEIALNVASSGIAALLFEGGRTAHSRTLRDICTSYPSIASDEVFGGKVILFGGDFLQSFWLYPMAADKM
ncbi:ATP-dependent DNA helicase PIF1-like protein [Tanacetum coccineum]